MTYNYRLPKHSWKRRHIDVIRRHPLCDALFVLQASALIKQNLGALSNVKLEKSLVLVPAQNREVRRRYHEGR